MNPISLTPQVNHAPAAGAKSSASPSAGSQKMTPAQISKVRKAAAEFESMMLSSFWKSMKESFGDDDDDSLDAAHDTLNDMGMQAMSSAVGKAGGLGLGKLILKHIAPGVSFQPGSPAPDSPKPILASADSNSEVPKRGL